jgi:hypothetical protein
VPGRPPCLPPRPSPYLPQAAKHQLASLGSAGWACRCARGVLRGCAGCRADWGCCESWGWGMAEAPSGDSSEILSHFCFLHIFRISKRVCKSIGDKSSRNFWAETRAGQHAEPATQQARTNASTPASTLLARLRSMQSTLPGTPASTTAPKRAYWEGLVIDRPPEVPHRRYQVCPARWVTSWQDRSPDILHTPARIHPGRPPFPIGHETIAISQDPIDGIPCARRGDGWHLPTPGWGVRDLSVGSPR